MHALAAEICLRNIVSTKPDSPSQGSIFRINKEAKPEGQKFDGFRRYSDLYWAVHCRLAVGKRDQEMLKDTLDTFLSGSGDGTSSIENWAVRIQTYPRNDDDLFFLWDSELEYPEELEDVQPAKEFAEATGLFVCCAFDLEEFLERLVGGDMRKMTWLNSKGRTPLQAAARNGSYNVLKRLLGQGEKTISITKDVIEEAARNSSNGNKMMELLLRWHGGNVSITITLVEAAARNYGKGKDIMMLLLKQDSADILILEVTKAIAKHFDQEVIECLLRRPGTDQSAIKAIIEGASRNYNSSNHIMDFLLKICRVEMLVTDDIIAEITENFEENIMKSLLDQPEADVSITDAVVEAAARNYKNGKNIMKLLLGQCRVDMSTEAIVLGITKHFDQEVMDCLLKRLGVDTVLLTEEVVRAARLNYKDGNNIMKLLLGRCRVDISPEVIILEITKHFDQEVMDCLLTRLGANSVLLTEEVVKAAAIWNYKNRNDIMKLLIQKGTVEIPIAEAIVLAIVRNFDQEVMECLLDGPGVGTSDTQDIFKAAAANYTDGENLIAVLLERFKAEVSITESIIKAVVGNSGQGKEIIVLLLDQHGLDISVTKGVVESAAANFQHGKDIMKLLINKTRSGMPITEATVLEIAERFDQDVMSYLLTQRRADIIVTTKLVASIARRFDQETMKCLLDRQDVEVSVTESIVRAAARNSNSSYGKGVIKLLLSQSRVKIPTEETGIAITEHFDQETMEILLARTDVEVSVTESIVRAAAWNSSHGKGVMKRLLNQCRIEMSMEELVLAVIRDFDQEVIDCLLGRPGVDVLLTEKIVSAAVYTYKDVKAIMKSLLDGCKNDQPITEKMVLEITKRFDQDVMTCLLKNYGGDMPITEEIVLEIAQKFDQHTIADLFAQREGVVPVTKRIIEIIARRFDQDLLASLLGRPGADVLVTKAVVEAAAANSEHGKGVMTLLLDRYKSRVSIAESVVVNIVRNSGNGREIMALVLKKSGVGVSVTGRVVKAAANNPTNGNGILKLLIDHYRTDIPITEVIEAIAQHSDQDVMNCLLDRSRADVLVTESVVEAAAANSKNGKEIMRLLFNRYRKGLQFTETTVVTVAKRFGPEVIKFLLDQRGADALVTEAVVEAAARNRDFRHSENGKDIIKKLIDKYQKDWPIREVIQAIAENFDREVMEHLLKRLGSDILVTEGVVRAAAQNYKNSNDIMKLLLQKGTVEIPVAEETVVSIAQNFDKETMAYLLSTYGATITITDAVMVAITERFDQDVVGPLLKLRGADILVTKAMIKAAAVKPYGDNRESIRLLLGHRGGNTSFTEAIIEAAGGNWPGGEKMILLLFDQWISHIQVTEEVVEVVAGNQHGDELMVLLFDRRGEDVRITDGTVKAAAGNENCGDKVIDLLLSQRGEEIWITDGVVRAAAGNENCGERVMNILLNRQGGDIQITEDVLKAVANEAYDAKVMTLFLDQRGDEFQITEEVVKAAAGNECCGDEVLELLLNRRGEEVQITEEVVKAAAGNECCGDLVLELLLDRRGGEFQITEEVAKAAAGNECCGDEVLELLLDRRRGEFQITEEVVKAAVSNIGRGYKVMRHLRNRRGGDSQVTEDAKVAIERFWS
jgi:F0F1-type ATP synthase delta subunit